MKGQFQVVPRTGPFRVLPGTVNSTPQNSERSRESSSASTWFSPPFMVRYFRLPLTSNFIDASGEKKEEPLYRYLSM